MTKGNQKNMHYTNDELAHLAWSFEPYPGEFYAFDGALGDEVYGGQCDDCGGSHYRIEATHTVLCHTCGRHIPIRQRRAADCIW